MSDFFPGSPPPATDGCDNTTALLIPDARDPHASSEHPIHCTMHAIELATLADHHDAMAAHMRRDGKGEMADLMQARAAELRRLAVRARGGK